MEKYVSTCMMLLWFLISREKRYSEGKLSHVKSKGSQVILKIFNTFPAVERGYKCTLNPTR